MSLSADLKRAWILAALLTLGTGASAAATEFRVTEATVVYRGVVFVDVWRGRTSAVEGVVIADPADLAGAVVLEIRVDLRTLDSGIRTRDGGGREALAAGDHPFAVFSGGRVVSAEDQGENVAVTIDGILEVRGRPAPARIEALVSVDGSGFRFTGRLTVRLSDHQIPPPTLLFFTMEDEVQITIEGRLVPAGR
jgi:polyisoprenoid-binding protein YceI